MKLFHYFTVLIILLSLSNYTHSQTKFRAKDQISAANNYAQSHYSGGVMYAISSAIGLDSTGKAITWLYYYYKPNVPDSSYVIEVTVIIIPIVYGYSLPPIPGIALRPLGTNFCNSDESILAAENSGGREFRNSHPQTTITATVFKLPVSPDTSKAYWTYIYNDSANNQNRIYNVDGTLCQIIILGINNTSSQIPDKLVLYQNYPNPFNPSTKIKFSVPQNDYVILDVYDITGKEIKRLIAENMKPGTYEIELEVENLTSGVYFYRLQSQGYSETKKMLILK